jgi:L-ribulose-5-phosphate 3-epimerase
MNRREFLRQTAFLGAGASLLAPGCAKQMAQSPRETFNISLAQWSLHRTLRAKQLDNLDFALAARRDYRIEAVEYVSQFFMDKATDATYLAEMKRRADDAGVRSLLIMCDSEGNLGDVDAAIRTQAVSNHHKWVDAARILGCHSVRVNAASQAPSYEEQMKLAADGLHRLAEYGERQSINVIVENHGGLSSNATWLMGTLRMADHPRLGTLPDFGNFLVNSKTNEWYDRYRGVDEMMPFAKGVSAKSHDFDAAGNETQTDFRRMLKIVMAHGYHGYVGIEYEGNTLSEAAGIRATRDLLLRVRAELAA